MRPDISFEVDALARQVHGPTERHALLLKRLLRYVSGTRRLEIRLSRTRNHVEGISKSLEMQAMMDSDWAGDKEFRKSTMRFLVTFNDAPVAWKSQKQSIVAMSPAEAEYVSLSNGPG